MSPWWMIYCLRGNHTNLYVCHMIWLRVLLSQWSNNTLTPGPNGGHFVIDTFKCIFVHERWYFDSNVTKICAWCPADNKSALVKSMNTFYLNQWFQCQWRIDASSGPVFCLLPRVSSDYAHPITGQVTEVTCPVIGRAQPELTPSNRQKTTSWCDKGSQRFEGKIWTRFCLVWFWCDYVIIARGFMWFLPG